MKKALLACSLLLLGGCSWPTTTQLIAPPKAEAKAKPIAQLEALIGKKNQLVTPANRQQLTPYLLADVTGDGTKEYVVPYRKQGREHHVLVASQAGKKIADYRVEGYDVRFLDVIDVTGDGKGEIVSGTGIGAAYSGLAIHQWNGKAFSLIGSEGYTKMDILTEGKRPAFALWTHDTGAAYFVDIYRWNGKRLVKDKSLYKGYFPKVVEYYRELVQQEPEAKYLLYYLARAEAYAGKMDEARHHYGQLQQFKQANPDGYPFAEQMNELQQLLQ